MDWWTDYFVAVGAGLSVVGLVGLFLWLKKHLVIEFHLKFRWKPDKG